jgi:hypothetical protein
LNFAQKVGSFSHNQIGAMKAKSFLLTVSLAVNLVLGWMLWQRHPALISDPVVVQSDPSEDETLPLPTSPAPLTESALLPPVETGAADTGPLPAPSGAQARLLPPAQEKPYAPAPPPNPHAFPLWLERMPYRDSQIHRALIAEPPR